MFEVNNLMVTTSAVRNVSGVEIFNIHVQDMSKKTYVYVDFVYPYMEIASAMGFDDKDLEDVKKLCADHIDELKEFASTQKQHNEPIPDDMMAVINKHQNS